MEMTVEKISAITFRVTNMKDSVQFYRDVLGMEIIYGGEDGCFSSLRTKDVKDPILNLEQGTPAAHWGRMIFYVADVDAFCRDFIRRLPVMLHGANDIFTCLIPMATSCRLRVRSNSLLEGA